MHDAFDIPPPPPPPPDMASQAAVVAVDITDKITKAASTLPPGELVKDGFFTLFESVGALEIMDPKMDSAVDDPHDELGELYDVKRELLPDEVLGIMDQLLCHEMAWHLGYPLSQTLFTCVYIEEILMPAPESITQADFIRNAPPHSGRPMLSEILRAYCVGVLKTCSFVARRIKGESYYEEEDFVSNTYNRTLLDSIDLEDILDCLQNAISLVSSLADPLPSEVAEALNARLVLRDAFLRAVVASEDTADHSGIREAWTRANEALVRFKSTTSVPVTKVADSFSIKIQQKLASTMPPRPIVKLSFTEATGHLTRLLEDGLKAVDITDYSDPHSLLTSVSTFQARKPQPLVYVRCLIQGLIFNDMVILGNKSMRQVLDDDFSMLIMSWSVLLDRSYDEVEAVHDPRFQIAQHMEKFRQKAAPIYFEIPRVLCLNRCRVRRTLVHLVREWDYLHGEAEQLDQTLSQLTGEEPSMISLPGNAPAPMLSLPLSSWACLHKLRLMNWIVQLGFELDVYQNDELASMYWYLNYLSKQRYQLLERTKAFVDVYARKPRSQRRVQADPRVIESLAFLRFSILETAIIWDLSDSLTCLYTALLRLKLIKPPPRPYSTDELRYELRMRPFSAIGVPEMIPYQLFKESVEQGDVPTDELLDKAAKAAASARKSLEAVSKFDPALTFSGMGYKAWLDGAKSALKSCIAMSVVAASLRKMVEAAGPDGEIKAKVEIPEASRAYHEWWIVPKVIPL